jgi:hypothetical protein
VYERFRPFYFPPTRGVTWAYLAMPLRYVASLTVGVVCT